MAEPLTAEEIAEWAAEPRPDTHHVLGRCWATVCSLSAALTEERRRLNELIKLAEDNPISVTSATILSVAKGHVECICPDDPDDREGPRCPIHEVEQLKTDLTEEQQAHAETRRLARQFIEAADRRVTWLAVEVGHDDHYFDSYHDARMPLALDLEEQ